MWNIILISYSILIEWGNNVLTKMFITEKTDGTNTEKGSEYEHSQCEI